MSAKFPTFFPIRWFSMINGGLLNTLFGFPSVSYEDGITAVAAATQATAYQLSAVINRLSTVVNADDGVKLMKTKNAPGSAIVVINDGAQNATVFSYDSATIDGGSGAVGVVVGTGKRTTFYNVGGNAWYSAGASKST